MNNNTANPQKRTGWTRFRDAASAMKRRMRPYALALGFGLSAPLLASSLPGCAADTATETSCAGKKTVTDVSYYAIGSREYAVRNGKIYANGTKTLCTGSETMTLIEADVASGKDRVVADPAGPIANIDGPSILLLSAKAVTKQGDTCSQGDLAKAKLFNTDVAAAVELPITATVARIAGTSVAYEADNGNGGYDIYIHEIVSGNSRKVAQNQRMVQSGQPFDGKTLFTYDENGLYAIDALTAKSAQVTSDNTVIPYAAGDIVGYYDGSGGSVNFNLVSDGSSVLSVSAIEAGKSPNPVAVLKSSIVVITPDMGVLIKDKDPNSTCELAITFTELTQGWVPEGDLTSFVAEVMPAGDKSFTFRFGNRGNWEGYAVIVDLK